MNRFFTLISWMMLLSLSVNAQVEYVNPIIGTDGMGHTFPGACVPFGIVQLSPDTDTIPHNINGIYQKRVYEYCAGYQYKDSTIVGFSHTHFNGTGHSDLGDILILQMTETTLALHVGANRLVQLLGIVSQLELAIFVLAQIGRAHV